MKECSKCHRCYEENLNFCPHDNNSLIITIAGSVVISGRYILEERLGKGGMGIVFKAKHKFLKSSHAIKVILPNLVQDDNELLVRFKQEAVLAASIDHQNVIRVTDFGVEDEKMPYLVMEFVDGTPLSHYLGLDKKFPVEKAYECFQPIALGVAEAHRKGIIHRDLKPQNIMVQKGLPLYKAIKVLDFGLAKIKSVESFGSLVQAQTMNMMGSPQYMSPEQWEDEEVNHHTDIYALGVILFQMLAGQLPFQADSIPSVMYQHLTTPPPTFASLGVSISPEIEAVVRQTLEKDPKARPASVEEMLNDLEQAMARSGIPITVNSYAPPTTAKPASSLSDAKTTALTDTQKERILNYFDYSAKPTILADEQLAQEFLEAQDRAEQAKVKANQADKLVQEFAEAQKLAEQAQARAIEAKQKIEADVRRRVEAEMESKLAEQQERQKAEAERLAREAEARKKAEERANYLAQAALEAQKIAEAEKKKSERAALQRELEESERRKAEITASKLAEQVTEAKKKYEEAKNQAVYEAELRRNAEIKRQKIEAELQAAAEAEAERRARAEAEARKQIEQQALRFEQEALAAQKRVEEARWLAEMEAQKREEAELAKQRAEEEAQRLAQEIIEVQKRMEEFKMNSSAGMQDQTLNLLDFHSSEHPQGEISPVAPKDSPSKVGGTPAADDDLKESAAQTTQYSEQTIPIVKVGNQPTPAQEHPRLTIATQPAASSNPSFSNLLNPNQPPAGRRTSVPIIAGGLAVLLTFLLGGYLLYSFVIREPEKTDVSQNSNKAETNSGQTDNSANPQNTKPSSDTEAQMILVEGGNFEMGRNDVPKTDLVWGNQYPAHTVPVKSFSIDKTEVSNEKYSEFVQASGHPAPSSWKNGKPPRGDEKYPVTNVSLSDAKAYADWFSKRNNKACRLPTEEEWEFAARNGSQQTSFPWGNDWRAGMANIATGRSAEVGTSSDETLAGGIKDMLGSVIEWTSSEYALYGDHPGELVENRDLYVVRGSSWGESEDRLNNAQWLITRRQSVPEQTKSPFLGFRLVCQP